MSLQAYLQILRRRWRVIAATTIVAIITCAIVWLWLPQIYRSTVTIRFATPSVGSADYMDYNLPYADRMMNTFAELANSPAIAQRLRNELKLAEAPNITVDLVANSELVEATVGARDPALAQQLAAALGTMLIAEGNRLHPLGGGEANATAPVTIAIAATLPQVPVLPRFELLIGLSVVAGLVGGVGLAFFFERLDTTIYTMQQLQQATNHTVLSTIPVVSRLQSSQFLNGNSPQGEAFRQLRAALFPLKEPRRLCTLLVTSAQPGEGKSTVAANLGIAIAQSGHTVVVVDADLRLPTLHTIFGLPNERGLSNVLSQQMTFEQVLQQSSYAPVSVITSGPAPSHPAELLNHRNLSDLLDQLQRRFDVVLFDSPSLLAVADAATLAPLFDGVVLVAGRTRVRHEQIEAAVQQIEQLNARLVGVVLNHSKPSVDKQYYQQSR